jgi:hypothetical protein
VANNPVGNAAHQPTAHPGAAVSGHGNQGIGELVAQIDDGRGGISVEQDSFHRSHTLGTDPLGQTVQLGAFIVI